MRFELLQVDSENGSVQVREIGLERIDSGRSTVLKVEPRENGEERGYELEDGSAVKLSREAITAICLADISFDDFVDFYGELVDRTVLCHPMIERRPSVFLAAPAQNKLEAVRDLERTLQERGIGAIRDGDKFALLVPTNLAKSISTSVAKMPAQKLPDTNSALPCGAIEIDGADLAQVLPFYGDLIQRKLVQTQPLFGTPVFLHNQTALTKAEAIYAFDTLLGWQGFKVVIVDAKSFRVVRTPTELNSGKRKK